MVNYDFLTELADSDEMQDEICQCLCNLQTLLDVKKRLGDLVDITDRLFGYMLYCEEGNNPFIFSTISVIFSLPEELEAKIDEGFWTSEDWEAEGYPKVDFEEIYSLYIPFDCSKEQMETALSKISTEKIDDDFKFLVKEDHMVVYSNADYLYEINEIILEICIELRQILEGGEADVESPNQ